MLKFLYNTKTKYLNKNTKLNLKIKTKDFPPPKVWAKNVDVCYAWQNTVILQVIMSAILVNIPSSILSAYFML